MDKIIIEIEIDLKELSATMNNAEDLKDNDAIFKALTSFAEPKKVLEDALDELKSVEALAKSAIQAKATTLYGEDWGCIKGHGYKISESATGAVFDVTGKPNKKFIVTKVAANTKEIEDYIKLNSKLPAGIEVNKNRGKSLRVTLHEDPQT